MSRVGLAGGLALLWVKSLNLELLSYSHNHIDTRLKWDAEEQWVRVTGIYGVPEANRRKQTWDLIRRLGEDSSMPWFIGGDFNEILNE